MTLYRAMIEILVEAPSEVEAMDGVGEMLRPHLQDVSYNFLLDWQYPTDPETGTYAKPTEISVDSAVRRFDEFEGGS